MGANAVDCRRARKLIYRKLLGDLPSEEAGALRRHASACPACREALRGMEAALSPVARSEGDRVVRDLAQRVVRPAQAAIRRIRRRRHAWRVALPAAAALLLVALGLLSERGTERAAYAACACWRFVGGDAGNSHHIYAGEAPAPQRVLWRQEIGGVPGGYKPLAFKDVVIVGTSPSATRGAALRQAQGRPEQGRGAGGSLVAFEAATGALRWRRDFPAGDFYKWRGFPDRCIQAGRLYVTNGEQCLVLDASTGEDVARLNPPPGATGWGFVTADESRLVGAGRDGRSVFCLDASTGRPVWFRALPERAFVPAMSDGRVYLSTDGGFLMALDLATGTERWRCNPAAPPGRATVHARGDWVFVLSMGNDISAFRARTGAFVWRQRVSGSFASGLAVGDEAVYTLGGAVALALDDGRVLRGPTGPINGQCSPPALAGTYLLTTAGAEAGALNVFDPSGQLASQMAGVAQSACEGAIVSGGRIYVAGAGHLLAVACSAAGEGA